MSDDDDDGHLSCWKWVRERGGNAVEDYWTHYPGAAENYDSHEVTTLFWEARGE